MSLFELMICVTVSGFKVVDDFILFFSLITADEVTRDYAYGETDPLVRRCRLIPWIPADLGEVSSATSEPPDSYYEVSLVKKRLAFRLLVIFSTLKETVHNKNLRRWSNIFKSGSYVLIFGVVDDLFLKRICLNVP